MVDYFGIAYRLKEALSVYSAEDIEGALRSLAEETRSSATSTPARTPTDSRLADPAPDAEPLRPRPGAPHPDTGAPYPDTGVLYPDIRTLSGHGSAYPDTRQLSGHATATRTNPSGHT